jgi:eukaryotic-like serine/threonine-protein kinase
MSQAPTPLAAALSDRYRLDRELGQGGMATVYLAHDLRNNRPVALKVLRPELAAILGAERFLKEIETTANLQHPHILPLFDSGEAGGGLGAPGGAPGTPAPYLYYVMPYVEGESLRDRLNREKQLPIADAVRITTEVASALDYAHRHGVFHRDIKPENILLHDGRALVADFGIALAVSRSDASSRMTETGMSLGTPHYMSPEQAMGEREITARSDVYALGCVAYEMLTGDPPFTGSTAQAIVARVMTEAPRPLIAQRRTIPPEVEAAVLTALEKLPADRFATAAEFAEALAGHRAGAITRRAERAVPAAQSSRRAAIMPIAIGALALLATFIGGWFSARRNSHGAAPLRLSINLPAELQLASGVEPIAALSPDGAELVFSGQAGGTMRLFSRRVDQVTPVPLGGTDGGCCPVFSADGSWIQFLEGATLRRIPRRGGAAITIPAPADSGIATVHWAGTDQFIVTRQDGSLAALTPDGALRSIARPDSTRRELSLDVMQVLPGGAALVIGVTAFPSGPLLAIEPKSGRRTVILETPVQWAGYAAQYLVWVGLDNLLYASRFDPDRLRTTGTVRAIGASPQVTRGFRPKVTLSSSGALAYVPAQPLSLVTIDRTGRVTTMLDQPRSYHSPRVSPDGRSILFDFQENGRDVWRFNLRDTTLTRVTFENSGHDPTWLPDGQHLLYGVARGNRVGIFRRNVDGSGVAESVLVAGAQITAHAVTPDGRTAVAALYGGVSASGDFDLMLVPLDGTRKPEKLLATRYFEGYPALSPDGRWLAYVSDETNRMEVYVRPLQGGGSKVLVSQNGGTEPVWARDGHTLFYRSLGPRQQQLIAAPVEARADFQVLSRTALFDVAEYEAATPHANYDVMPDGKSFVMVRMGRLSEFVYLQSWIDGLKRSEAVGAP